MKFVHLLVLIVTSPDHSANNDGCIMEILGYNEMVPKKLLQVSWKEKEHRKSKHESMSLSEQVEDFMV